MSRDTQLPIRRVAGVALALLLLVLYIQWLPVSLFLNSKSRIWQENQTAASISTTSSPPVKQTEAEHPRLFFRLSDRKTIRNNAATTHKEIWEPILAYAKTQLGTMPPSVAPPTGTLDTYRNYGNQMIALAFVCVVTEQENYCKLAKTYLLTYADWKQWGELDQRGLGHAHMLLGNGLGYDWLYPMLTPSERQRVRTSLGNWAHKMYEASASDYQETWNNWWRKSYVQNYYWTTNGALGIAGLALLGEDERAQTWIDQASRQLSIGRYFLNNIADGSWHEGITYQDLTLITALPFMVNLREIQGIDILPDAYLAEYPVWKIYNYLPGSSESIMAYGDFEWSWLMTHMTRTLLRFTAREYDNGYAEWLTKKLITIQGRVSGLWTVPWYVFEFLYYDPSVPTDAPTNLALAHKFSDAEGVIWRTGWNDNELVFALKTGAYGGRFSFSSFVQQTYPWESPCQQTGCSLNTSHDHDDSNGFYLYRGGQWLAPEVVGTGKFTTTYHNTILIDGQGQYRPPDNHFGMEHADFQNSDGYLKTSVNTPYFDYVAADATQRYKNIPGVKDVTRHVLFIRPDYFIMLDSLAADQAHDYTWVCHFGENVSIQDDWIKGDANDGQVLGVGIVTPQPFKIQTGADGRPNVHIQPVTPTANARFVTLLYPTDETNWDTRPDVRVLANTDTAIALHVQMRDGRDRGDEVSMTYDQPSSIKKLGNYTHDGQAVVVSRGADNQLEKLFMYGGTFLTDESEQKPLVRNLSKNTAFEATYTNDTVTVYSNSQAQVVLYAPNAVQLIVNGVSQAVIQDGDYINFEIKKSNRDD